ncbi:MAG TPA: TonB-dependent receptor [Gemmatimonadaceae bacterium]
MAAIIGALVLPCVAAAAVPAQGGGGAAGGAASATAALGPAAGAPGGTAGTAAARAAGANSVRPQARRVTLELHDAALREALKEIARQSGAELLYSEYVVPLDRRITITVREATVEEALRAALKGTGVEVRPTATGELMLVRPARPAPPSREQRGSVSGHVTDSTSGAPVVGAAVSLEGTTFVVATDGEGAYRLASVEAGEYTMVVRRLGYARVARKITVPADRDTTVDVRLAPAAGVLEQVVVTGAMIPTAIKAIPTPITVVTDSQIARQYIRRTDQIFREFVPGVIAWDLGLTGSDQNSVAARGASSLFVSSTPKIYIDGVEASNATFTVIDPSSIERVEIVRGPEAATLYGSDAMGGVMQVFTKRGSRGMTRPQVDAEVSLGAIQSQFQHGGTLRQNYSFSLHGGSESAGYNIGASYGHIGDWLPGFFLSSPSLYGGVHIVNRGLTLDLSARSYSQSMGFTNNPRFVALGLSDSTLPYEQATFGQQTAGIDAKFAATSWWRHQLTLGVDRFDLDDHSTRARLTTPADTFLYVFQGARKKSSVRYNTSMRMTLGSDVTATTTLGIDHWELSDNSFVVNAATNLKGPIGSDPNSPVLPDREVTSNTGYFGQLQVATKDAFFATAGIRAERNTNFGSSHPTVVAPKVGLTYVAELGALTLKVRGSYGEAIRPPTSSERVFSRSPYFVILANESIKPERQRGTDFGVDVVAGPRWSFGATYYSQIATNLIQRVLVSTASTPPSFQFQNLGQINNTGLELEGTLHSSVVDITAHYAITSSKVRHLGSEYQGDLQPGDQVLGIPRHTGGVTATFRPREGTDLSVGLSYIGEWTNYDYLALYGGEDRGALRNYWKTYPSFVKANVAVTQQLGRGLSGFVSIENVANSRAYEGDNYNPVQGRITMMGFHVHY